MGSKTKIAIIDRGVDRSYHRLRNCQIEEVIISDTEEEISIENNLGHGTSIANLIHSKVPEIPIVSIKLSSKNAINSFLLAKAIDYCKSREDIKVINISLGLVTVHPSNVLFKSCWDCYQHNKVIVAAVYSDPNLLCYPAAFPFVIGVDIGLVQSSSAITYLGEGYINFLAKGIFMRMVDNDMTPKMGSGSSYATAFISAIFAQTLKKNPSWSISKLKKYFKGESNKVLPLRHTKQNRTGTVDGVTNLMKKLKNDAIQIDPCSTGKYALFPVNHNKIDTICRLRNYININITLLIGYPNVACPYPKLENIRYIPGLLSPKIFKYADTIVLDNFIDQASQVNIIYGYHFIRLALEHHISFVFWDRKVHQILLDMIDEIGSLYKGNLYPIYQPIWDKQQLRHFTTFPLPTTKTLAFIGISSNSNTLANQMILKNILKKEKYAVKYLGTESFSRLLGAAQIFDINNLELPEPASLELWSIYYSNQIKALNFREEIDFIITGIETFWTNVSEREMVPDFDKLKFLQATQSKFYIISIGGEDQIEAIERNLSILYNNIHSNVLFFAIDASLAIETKNWLDRNTNIPILNLSNMEDVNKALLIIKPIKAESNNRAISPNNFLNGIPIID